MLSTPDYTKWSDEYYRSADRDFSGRHARSRVGGGARVFQLPFHEVAILRPAWIDPSLDAMFRYRGDAAVVARAFFRHSLPPSILAVGTSVVSMRLFGLAGVVRRHRAGHDVDPVSRPPRVPSRGAVVLHLWLPAALCVDAAAPSGHAAASLRPDRGEGDRDAATSGGVGRRPDHRGPCAIKRATSRSCFPRTNQPNVERIDTARQRRSRTDRCCWPFRARYRPSIPARFVDTNVLSLDDWRRSVRQRYGATDAALSRRFSLPLTLLAAADCAGARSAVARRRGWCSRCTPAARARETRITPLCRRLRWRPPTRRASSRWRDSRIPKQFPLLLESLLLPEWRAVAALRSAARPGTTVV